MAVEGYRAAATPAPPRPPTLPPQNPPYQLHKSFPTNASPKPGRIVTGGLGLTGQGGLGPGLIPGEVCWEERRDGPHPRLELPRPVVEVQQLTAQPQPSGKDVCEIVGRFWVPKTSQEGKLET